MIVRRFELAQLEQLPASAGSRASELSAVRAATVGKALELRTSPFGKGVVTCTDVGAPREPDQGDVVWALSHGADASFGYLVVETMTALRIVAATLGVPAPRVQRALGTSERGIVSAAIATALRSLRSDLALHLGRQRWSGQGRTRLFITAEFQGMRERLRLDVLTHWLPPVDHDAWWAHHAWLARATALGLEVPFILELARTTLTAADWSRARVGDAVVFDVPMAAARTERSARLVCRAFACPITVAADGRTATMVAEFQPNQDQPPTLHERFSKRREDEAMSHEPPDAALTMLASAPIEVVAELGRMFMRADEVTALRPGSVLQLGPLRPNTVTLRVGDRSWAEGELVDIDGELGVRLTALSAPLPIADRATDPAEAETLR